MNGSLFRWLNALTLVLFASIIYSSAAKCVPAPAGLVSWWRAEGNALDSAGTNNGTTPFGIAYTNGEVGQAFSFNASGTRVSIPDNDTFKLTNSLTIEGWVKINADGGFILLRGDDRPGLDPYSLTMGSSGHVNFHIESLTNYIDLEAPITYGVWNHVGATLDGATGDMRIYINGALAAQTNTTIRPLSDLDPAYEPAVGIGNHGGTYHDFSFNGLIDEISLYSRALSQSEIQSIYDAGSAGKCLSGAPVCTPAPSGLVSWWRAEGNALDSAGTNNGTTPFGIAYNNGEVGQAFSFNASGTRVSIPDNDTFKLTNSLTIEGWVKINADGGFILLRGDDRPGLDPYALAMGSSGHVNFHIESLTNYIDLEAPIIYSVWNHVGATLDGATGDMRIYINGALAAQTNTTIRPLSDLDPAYEPAVGIGNHGGTFHDFSFNGLIDEISLYARALSQSEIQGIYNAGFAGKCFVGVPPTIVTQPASQTVPAGTGVTFNVVVSGTPPLTYHWFKGGGSISGATNSTYVIASAQVNDAGAYSVVVSNAFGFAISANAQLIVVSGSTNCFGAPAGLVGWWKAEGNALDSAGTNNGTTPFDIAYGNGEVGRAFSFNASGTRVSIPDNDTFKLTNSLTIEGWVKINADGGFILFRGDDRPGLDPYALTMGSGHVSFHIESLTSYINLEAPVTYGVWNHLAATLEGSTGDMKIYVNGALAAQTNTSIRPLRDLDPAYEPAVGIGNHGGEFHDFSFNGLIDEISLYSRALSQSEIQSIYNAGSAGKCVSSAPVCTPAPSGLVSWWRAEGNALDSAGTNNGTTPFGIAYLSGEVGQAFSFNASGTRVSIPDNDTFKLTNSVTIEGWVKINADGGFILFRGDDRPGLDPYALTMGSSGHLSFHIESLSNYINLEAPITYSVWNHVGATLDGATGDMRIYINGALAAQTNTTIRPLSDLDPAYEPAVGIGNHGGTYHDFSFNGLIDEISLYSRALSQSEIQTIYNAGSAGKCFAGVRPTIVSQPASQTIAVGASATFSVVVSGTPPFIYQWHKGGASIPGATNSAHTIASAQTNDAGAYSVVISNAFGFATSSNAMLTVVPSSTNWFAAPAGLVGWWKAEGNASDSAGTNNGSTPYGISYTNGEVGQTFNFNGSGQKVTVPDYDDLKLTNSLTIEGWVFARGPGFILFRGDSRPGLDPYALSVETSGVLQLLISDATNNNAILRSSAALPTDQWKHVAATLDGAAGDLSLYIDGALVAQTNTTIRPLRDLDPSYGPGLAIGGHASTYNYFPFNGMIDEISLYSRALSQSEIQSIYNAGSAGKYINTNHAPVAQCTTVIVSAGSNFVVGASVDHGSFDPDGDPIVLTQSPLGPYPIGTNHVTLTVTDSHGASNSCSAFVIVLDPTPVFSISLPPPQLTIIPSGANVILTWPTNASGLTLQSTTNLVSPAVWSTCSSAPVVIGGQNVVINPISGPQRFYRLSQ